MGEFRPHCRVQKDESLDGAVTLYCRPTDESDGVPFRCPKDVEIQLHPRKGAKLVNDGGCRDETVTKLLKHINKF